MGVNDEYYEVPVDFRDGGGGSDRQHPDGRHAAASTTGSLASSSRVASAASAPVGLGGDRSAADTDGGQFHDVLRRKNKEPIDAGFEAAAPVDGGSLHSSPHVWSSSSPGRRKSMRELEQKIRERKLARNARPFRATPDVFPGKARKREEEGDASRTPLPKVLTDALLQTALLGIDTTAKLSKPALGLTRDTLLPQIVAPLLEEVWKAYAPARMQAWARVLPTSLRNAGSLLWDTEAGRALGDRAGRLGEDALDVASSDVARQCWIDATVSLIKLMESLHTPEVKALLDQCAVGACRVVDVLSSGKAKQVWFDAADALWALIEVGSDPVMVVALAEVCAQVCFALEREREGLRRRRKECAGDGAAGSSNAKLDASKKRRERDRRQMGTYPPGRRVVGEGGGGGFDEALHDALHDELDGDIDPQEQDRRELEGQIYDEINIAEGVGPPQRVMVTASFSENTRRDKGGGLTNAHGVRCGTANVPHNDDDDDESELTTEIEDLHAGANPSEHDDVRTQSSASEGPAGAGGVLVYEREEGGDCDASVERTASDDGAASEMYGAFEEPILQFYRRLNEVLVETRKQERMEEVHQSRRGGDHLKDDSKMGIDGTFTIDAKQEKNVAFPCAIAPVPKGLFGTRKNCWKLIIIAMIFGGAAMCMLWFTLGCYGFYVLVVNGGHVHVPPSPPLNAWHTISIDELKKLKQDVDTIIKDRSERCIGQMDLCRL